MSEVDTPEPIAAVEPRWLRALYGDLVGQTPDRRALAPWLAAARRGASHREIASELLRSEDYCRAQIAGLFRSLLDRAGDDAGLAAWTESLMAGVALQDVIAGFCDSFEYKTLHPSASEFVESLYGRLLDRASDPAGKAARLAALRNRSSSLSVIRGVLCSAEYCTQRAMELHTRLLGREPDPSELLERIVALVHGAPLQQLALELVTSAEYVARATGGADEAAPAAALPATGAAGPEPRRADADADVLALVRERKITEALEQLMARHGAAVYRYCRTALGDATLAEDVQQQVFLEAFRDLPRFGGRSSLRTWLLGIARHRVLDSARRRRRTLARIDDAIVEPVDPAPSPDQGLDDARLRAALLVSLSELDEPVRTSVLLRYQQGLTYEEMAEICGEHAGTLQARVARAVRRLRDRIVSRTRAG
jgi:RNA polymerase sigma factor (sigma-70 family)